MIETNLKNKLPRRKYAQIISDLFLVLFSKFIYYGGLV